MFTAAITLAFFGFFRSSELCYKKRDRTSNLRHKDVHLSHLRDGTRYATINLRKSKANQFQEEKVYIYANGTSVCAIAAIKKYLRGLGKCNYGDAFFTQGRTPLTSARFNMLIKQAAMAAGLNPSEYSSHSLRAGVATSASESGVPSYTTFREVVLNYM